MLLPLWALRRIPTAPPKATRGWVTVKGILSPWVPLTLLWLELAYPGAAWLTSASDMLPFQCRHWSLVLFLQYTQALFKPMACPLQCPMAGTGSSGSKGSAQPHHKLHHPPPDLSLKLHYSRQAPVKQPPHSHQCPHQTKKGLVLHRNSAAPQLRGPDSSPYLPR